MNIGIALFVFITLAATTIRSQDESEEDKQERISTELKLADWGLADYHEAIVRARKKVLLYASKYDDEVEAIIQYGDYLQEQTANFLKIPEDDIPYEYQRNYTFFLKPGDFLMNNTELQKIVTFAKESDHISRNIRLENPNKPELNIGKQTFLDLLATSKNMSLLQELWSNWQSKISHSFDKYEQILALVNEAAKKNEMYDAKAYWEMLTEYENGYQKAEDLWAGIEPIYKQLHEFVLARINNYYESNFTDIPVYLTGSNFGEDWTNLADIIIPHQQMYKDAESTFKTLSIEKVYNLANTCNKNIHFKTVHLSKNSFKYEFCEPILLTYSASKYSEIFTCPNVTWNTYMNAHEIILKAGLKSLDFPSLPRRELRQSFMEEAIVSLGSIIAIQNLPNYGFTPESDYINVANATEYGLAAKLLVALRVLPKLAYYMAADTWRMEELGTPSGDIISSWWEKRNKYQGVEGVSNKESDFLGDPYITANKPYLSKFLGAVLLFELLNYHQLYPFTHNDNLAERLRDEIDLRNAIQDIPLKAPLDVLSYNYAISDISSIGLIEFFQPLEEYLNNAPLEPYPTITRIRKVDPPPEDATKKIFTTTESHINATTVEIEVPAIQNDQNVPMVTRENSKSGIEPTVSPKSPMAAHAAGIYVLITIGACFLILMGILVVKKLMLKRRPRTNNRRFET